FHLPEIGVDGEIEREVLRDAHLAIQSEGEPFVAAGRERIALFAGETLRARHRIGEHLDLPLRAQVAQPAQLPESTHPTGRVAWDELPVGAFFMPEDPPRDL